MDRRILLIVAALVVLAAGLYLFLPGPQGDYSKVLILRMHLTDGTVRGESAEVRYGHPQETSYRSGPLEGKLLTAEGKVTKEFSLWDPSVQLGDAVETDANGSEVFRSVTVVSRENDLLLVLPYSGEEKSFALSDKRTGRSLTTMDLTAAGDTFKKTYPADPGSPVKNQTLLPALEGSSVTIVIGVVLVLLLGIMVVSMLRRR